MQHFANYSEENYLKAIYKLGNADVKKVNNSALSKALDLNPATVLQMVRKMADRDMVIILDDKSIELTDRGKRKALQVIRRHRIWEVFLVTKLKFKWNEVHELAEQLEHIESDKLINKLDNYLGFPAVDPHGDPIPDEHGRMKKSKVRPLTEAPLNKRLTILALANTTDVFLRYLDKYGLSIGEDIEVLAIESFDRSVMIIHRDKPITLSSEAANNLLVNV